MASRVPALTQGERTKRHRLLVSVYKRGLCSRTVAEMFGLTDSHVRAIMRHYGVARKVGRPRRRAR